MSAQTKPSKKAMNLAARLMAVQAVYESAQRRMTLKEVSADYLANRIGLSVEGEQMVAPDKALFKAITKGVESDHGALAEGLGRLYNKDSQSLEPLLRAILYCGIYEITEHKEIDAPIIINDYVEITHSFYESSESGLVNALLDAALKGAR